MAFKMTTQERKAVYDIWVANKVSKVALARRYGVSARTIGRILEEFEDSQPKTYDEAVSLEIESPVFDANKHRKIMEASENVLAIQKVAVRTGADVANVICTNTQVMVTFIDGDTSSVSRSHKSFGECFDLVRDNKLDKLIEVMEAATAIKEVLLGDGIKVINGTLYYQGEVFDNRIAVRIVEEVKKGEFVGVQKYVKFMLRLLKNPSYKAVGMAYEFIEHSDLEITEDGLVKAYKRLKMDSGIPTDVHSGIVPNWKGWTVKMPRYLVEDNPDQTCSQGLHVASLHYFPHFSIRNSDDVVVLVDPEHIVSVPTDYDASKCRVCQYTLLTGTEHPDGLIKTITIGKNGKLLHESE